MKELVSIVLPVYNGAKFLRDSIDSVIAQTYQNWELLILDDCSTDETPEIALEYQAKDQRVHYYRNEKNLKLPGNLNKGFSLSKGDYLTWTSDDNLYYPQAIETMVTTLEEKNVGLVYTSYRIIEENGDTYQVLRAAGRKKGAILHGNTVGACFLYTREVYETIGDYDTDLFLVEDWDYWQRVIMKFPYYPITEVLYDYRKHGAALTYTRNQVYFGELCEKILLKNRPGFGKLSLPEKSGYYLGLSKARKDQQRKNPYAFKAWYLGKLCGIRKKLISITKK